MKPKRESQELQEISENNEINVGLHIVIPWGYNT